MGRCHPRWQILEVQSLRHRAKITILIGAQISTILQRCERSGLAKQELWFIEKNSYTAMSGHLDYSHWKSPLMANATLTMNSPWSFRVQKRKDTERHACAVSICPV